MSEKKEIKEEKLKEVSGGEFNIHLGFKMRCLDCGELSYEKQLGPKETCPGCGSRRLVTI